MKTEQIEQEKNKFVKQVAEQKYEFGFTTDIETEIIPVGLDEDVVRLISRKKQEPDGTTQPEPPRSDPGIHYNTKSRTIKFQAWNHSC